MFLLLLMLVVVKERLRALQGEVRREGARALAALGQARFPLRGFHPLGSRPLPACALAVAFAEPRDDPPGAELDHAWSEGATAVFAASLRMRRLRFAHGTSYL